MVAIVVAPRSFAIWMAAIPTLLLAADANGDGVLSFEEFASWWSRRELATAGSLDDSVMSSMEQQWADLDASWVLNCDTYVASGEWSDGVGWYEISASELDAIKAAKRSCEIDQAFDDVNCFRASCTAIDGCRHGVG